MELALIYDQSPYNENLLSAFANFDTNKVADWNKIGTGNLAFDSQLVIGGKFSLVAANTNYNSANTLAFDAGDNLIYFAGNQGRYALSFSVLVDVSYIAENIPLKVKIFVNGTPTDYDCVLGLDNEGFVFGEWNKFSQNLLLNQDDEVNFSFELGYDLASSSGNAEIQIDGLSLQLDNRKLGTASPYKPVEISLTGWASYTDTAYTSGSPLAILEGVTATIPNNVVTTEKDFLPTYVTDFYNGVTGKFFKDGTDNMGTLEGDYDIVTVAFKVKNSQNNGRIRVGLNNGSEVYPQIVTLDTLATVEQNLTFNFPIAISATDITNGLLPKFTSIYGNSTIYDIKFTVSRIHKA